MSRQRKEAMKTAFLRIIFCIAVVIKFSSVTYATDPLGSVWDCSLTTYIILPDDTAQQVSKDSLHLTLNTGYKDARLISKAPKGYGDDFYITLDVNDYTKGMYDLAVGSAVFISSNDAVPGYKVSQSSVSVYQSSNKRRFYQYSGVFDVLHPRTVYRSLLLECISS